MSNNGTCITPGIGSSTYGQHRVMVGVETASAMPQNILALSAFLSAIACNSTREKEQIHHDNFEYMQHPIAKITDVTEASEKLVRFTENEFLHKEVIKVGQNMYVAIGYALANSIMIEGK